MIGMVFGFPALLYVFTGKFGGWRGLWFVSQPAIVLSILVAFGGLGWLMLSLSVDLFAPLVPLGILCSVLIYGIWIMRGCWFQKNSGVRYSARPTKPNPLSTIACTTCPTLTLRPLSGMIWRKGSDDVVMCQPYIQPHTPSNWCRGRRNTSIASFRRDTITYR